MLMQTSRNGLLFIACREGIVEVAYPDGPHNSIGCGHNGPDVTADMRWSPQRSLEQLKIDVGPRERDIMKCLLIPVSQPQMDALVSLHYNRGNRDFPAMMKAVNSGDVQAVADLFPMLDTDSKGNRLEGLSIRRKAELDIYLNGNYGPLGSIPWWKGNPRKTKRYEYAVQPTDLA